ncbi:MAG: hypothetical protein K2X69_14465 [Silvanigrellaceae bacterium]|nr:hypothetical protein [Silvanigrellaceae bacterium]
MKKAPIELVKGMEIKKYGFFSNLKVVDFNEKEVVMEDKSGNKKTVYLSLFMRHAEIS